MISSYDSLYLCPLNIDNCPLVLNIAKSLKTTESIILFSNIDYKSIEPDRAVAITDILSRFSTVLGSDDFIFAAQNRKNTKYIDFISTLMKHKTYYELFIMGNVKYVITSGAINKDLNKMGDIDIAKSFGSPNWHNEYDGRLGYAIDMDSKLTKIAHHKYSSTINPGLYRIGPNGIRAVETNNIVF
jgi:hypothetical protein